MKRFLAFAFVLLSFSVASAQGGGCQTIYYSDADGDGYGIGTPAINVLVQGSSSASSSNGSLVIVGSDSGTGNSLTASVSFVATVSATYSFDWSYSTNDGPGYDPAYYINGVWVQLSNDGGPQTQSGTQIVTVTAGSIFGFSVVSGDDSYGSATLTINNFNGFTLPTFTQACSQPAGYALAIGDCNDNNASVNPGATEICNSIDDDCDTQINEGLTFSVTPSSQTNVSCFGGSNGAASINTPTGGAGGYTYNWTPGNPTGDGTVSVTGLTAGTWTCTVTDANTCTGTTSLTITEPSVVNAPTGNASQTFCSTVNATIASIQVTGTGIQWYASNTGGSVLATTTPLVTGTTYYATQTISGCESPSYLAVTVTITVASTYYIDADGDLYGNAGSSVQACAQPAGYVINNLDCNDVNSAISPTTIWYLDVDADGSYVSTYMSCTSPGANYNTTGGIVGDCNDNNPLIRPGVTETCNSIDDDCDALIDENSSNTY